MTEQVSIVNCVDNMMRNVKEFPFHLLDEMSDELKDNKQMKKYVECPICLEIIGDRLKITNCGHKYCETCYDKLDSCAIC